MGQFSKAHEPPLRRQYTQYAELSRLFSFCLHSFLTSIAHSDFFTSFLLYLFPFSRAQSFAIAPINPKRTVKVAVTPAPAILLVHALAVIGAHGQRD